MKKIKGYVRKKITYGHEGAIERLADTPTPWWLHLIDFTHNHIQDQDEKVTAYHRYTQLENGNVKFESFETDSTGVGMTLEAIDDKYLRALTKQESDDLSPEQRSRGLGVHTMGVKSFLRKMIRHKNPNVTIVSKTENDTDWVYLERDHLTLKDVVEPCLLSENELLERDIPVDMMGSKGHYLKIEECDASDWDEDWFSINVNLMEYYLKFAKEKQTIDMTFEFVPLEGKSVVKKLRRLVQPCVNSAPYHDVWEKGKVEIGGKTFVTLALERPKKGVLDEGLDFKIIRQKYNNQYHKHPIGGTEYDYRDNFRIMYEEKKTGIILGQEIVKATGIRHRGDMRVLVNKEDVKTDIAKSMITFYQSDGKTPYSRGSSYLPHKLLKQSFEELFPKDNENEDGMRVVLKDILTGKRWPENFTKISYIALCNELGIKPFDYTEVKKKLTSINILDSKFDLYYDGMLIEMKIKKPHKDLDYNQLLAYCSLFMSKNCNYPLDEVVMMAHSENDNDFDVDTIEKFTTRLNTHFDGHFNFRIINLKDYGLDSDSKKNGFKEPYKD